MKCNEIPPCDISSIQEQKQSDGILLTTQVQFSSAATHKSAIVFREQLESAQSRDARVHTFANNMAAADVLFLMGEDFDVFFDALEDDVEVQNLIEDAAEKVF